MVITGNDLGTELCKLLGLDAATVSKIMIRADAGEIAVVIVERAITDEQADGIKVILSRYVLVRDDAGNDFVPLSDPRNVS